MKTFRYSQPVTNSMIFSRFIKMHPKTVAILTIVQPKDQIWFMILPVVNYHQDFVCSFVGVRWARASIDYCHQHGPASHPTGQKDKEEEEEEGKKESQVAQDTKHLPIRLLRLVCIAYDPSSSVSLLLLSIPSFGGQLFLSSPWPRGRPRTTMSYKNPISRPAIVFFLNLPSPII